MMNTAVSKRSGSMHVDQAGRQYTTAGGERRPTRCTCCAAPSATSRASPRKETLANLSELPETSITALRLR